MPLVLIFLNNPFCMPNVLFAADFPPPFHGESIMVKNTVESDFAKEFNLSFVDTTPVKTICEINGKISLAKFYYSARAFFKISKKILFGGSQIFYKNLSSTTNGFIRDFILSVPALLTRKKIVLHIHCSNFGEFFNSRSSLLKKVISFLLDSSQIIIVPHESHRKQFTNIVSLKKVFSVQNGTGSFHSEKKKFNLKNPVILFLSNLFEEKGYLVLLEAISAVLKKFPSASFVFAGAKGDDFNPVLVKQIIDSNKIRGNVSFLGTISGKRKEELLRKADVFVLPTFYRREAMPVTILEAMAFGLPIVSTDTSAIPLIVQHKKNGLIVSRKDSFKLASAIISLLSSPALLEKISKNNITKYKSNYTAKLFSVILK